MINIQSEQELKNFIQIGDNKFDSTLYQEAVEKITLFRDELATIGETAETHKYFICGGLVKTIYNLRSASDVDYIINVPQGTDITTIKNDLFKDFGLSENFCETYYNPTNPYQYEQQQDSNTKVKAKVNESLFANILNQSARYSCSGLKIGINFSIYRQLIARYHHMIGHVSDAQPPYTLKEFIECDEYFIMFHGFKVLRLEYEFLRDEMKRIDLGRYSAKHKNDARIYCEKYARMASPNMKKALLLSMVKPPQYNLLHIGSDLPNGGKRILLRRISEKVRKIVGAMCDDFAALKFPDAMKLVDCNHGHFDNIYDNIMLTSLFDLQCGVLVLDYILYANGGISLVRDMGLGGTLWTGDYIIRGKLTFEFNGKVGKILYNFEELPAQYNTREYKLKLLDLMRAVFAIHKLYDQQCGAKVNIEYSSQSLG